MRTQRQTETLFKSWLESAPEPEGAATASSPQSSSQGHRGYQIQFAMRKALQFVEKDRSSFGPRFVDYVQLPQLTAGTFYKNLAEEVLLSVPPDVTGD